MKIGTIKGTSFNCILNLLTQGSVLGSLLYVIYINDIDISNNNVILKFADDTDLGVLIQDNLKASEQCTKVVKTCSRILCLIKRSFMTWL